jgi:hypothetical protein
MTLAFTPEVKANRKLLNKGHPSTSDWSPIEVGERNIYICSPERLKSSPSRPGTERGLGSSRTKMCVRAPFSARASDLK